MANVIDTDVLIDVTKGSPDAIAYLESLTDLAISSITAMEIIVGAKTQRQTLALDASLAAFPLLQLTPGISANGYDLLKQYARSHGLRPFDALLAATVLAGEHTLITRNVKHFRCIPNLPISTPNYR